MLTANGAILVRFHALAIRSRRDFFLPCSKRVRNGRSVSGSAHVADRLLRAGCRSARTIDGFFMFGITLASAGVCIVSVARPSVPVVIVVCRYRKVVYFCLSVIFIVIAAQTAIFMRLCPCRTACSGNFRYQRTQIVRVGIECNAQLRRRLFNLAFFKQFAANAALVVSMHTFCTACCF